MTVQRFSLLTQRVFPAREIQFPVPMVDEVIRNPMMFPCFLETSGRRKVAISLFFPDKQGIGPMETGSGRLRPPPGSHVKIYKISRLRGFLVVSMG
jgi:hypothetical protein